MYKGKLIKPKFIYYFLCQNRIDDMSERIDDLEKTVCKLVEESNTNESVNSPIEKNSGGKSSSNKFENENI